VAANGSAIFFDFDGVIVDSVQVKADAFVALYVDYGPEIMAKVAACHHTHRGKSRFEQIAYFQREIVHGPIDAESIEALSRRFSRDVKKRVIGAPKVPGAKATLERLAIHVPLFLVSATPEPELRDIVEAHGLTNFFSSIHGAPNPKVEVLAYLIERHRLLAASSIYFGDATADFDAARGNGVSFVGIVRPNGDNPFPEGTRILPDLIGLAERWLSGVYSSTSPQPGLKT
jgi:phosphoglycolate phosphatase-like HAD superfamily hydrolase